MSHEVVSPVVAVRATRSRCCPRRGQRRRSFPRSTSRRCAVFATISGWSRSSTRRRRRLAPPEERARRPHGGLRRPRGPGRARDHRRRRPDHPAAAPRPRSRASGPETLRRLQRQHQPAQLALVPRHRGRTRRLHPGEPGPWTRPPDAQHLASLRAALFGGDVTLGLSPHPRHGPALGRPGGPQRPAAGRARRAVDVVRPRACGRRPDVGRLFRDRPVDARGRPVSSVR